MFGENDTGKSYDESVDELLSWKPPKPTIDIDDISEIEKFLFGEQISFDIGPNDTDDEVNPFDCDSDIFESGCSDLASKFALFADLPTHSSDEPLHVDSETQLKFEALLEATGVGKFSEADRKSFADPEILRRLSSSVSTPFDSSSTSLRFENDTCASSSKALQKKDPAIENDSFSFLPIFCEEDNFKDGKSLLTLACDAGYCELVEVLLSVPPYADESTYLTDESSHKLREKINKNFLTTLNHQLTKILLSVHADVDDGFTKEELTPLMKAASNGHSSIVSLLLSHGTDPNMVSKNGNKALNYACIAGHDEVVKTLLKNNIDTEHRNNAGQTALMQASVGNHRSVVSVLLKHGTNVNVISNDSKHSALTLACEKGNLEVMKLLLESGSDLDHVTSSKQTPLMIACENGHVDAASLLLNFGASASKQKTCLESPLSLAASSGNLELARLLIEKAASFEERNASGFTPLMGAARKGNTEMIKLLVDKGGDINATTEVTQLTALSLSCSAGLFSCVTTLVKLGADLEVGGQTPLMVACKENHLEIVRFLCNSGSDVNAANANGESPLLIACEFGNTAVVEFLVTNGAEITHENKENCSSLMKAVQKNHLNIVKFLLDKGAKIDQVSSNKKHTALSLACSYGHCHMVEFLLSQGADPFCKLQSGCHAFLDSVKGHRVEIVKLLLDYSRKHGQLPHKSKNAKNSSNSKQLQSSLDLSDKKGIACETTTDVVIGSCDCDSLHNVTKSGSSAIKSCTDGDVLLAIDKFLRTVKDNHSDLHPYLADSIVEEAQVKLSELEDLIKEALDRNIILMNAETGEDGKLGNEELTRLYLNRENEIVKKRKILKDLQKVEHDLQRKANFPVARRHSESHVQPIKLRDCNKKKNVSTEDISDQKLFYKTNEQNLQIFSIPDASSIVEKKLKHCTPASFHSLKGRTSSWHSISGSTASHVTPLLVNECNDSRDSPLSIAVSEGDLEMVKLLLTQGADVYHRDKKGFTPLHSAAVAGHDEIVRTLLDATTEIDVFSFPTNDSPLSLACSYQRTNTVELLLRGGANVEHRNDSDYTPLCLAAASGYFELVELLLRHGADVDSRPQSKLGITPLLLASMNGHSDIVQLLLDIGADVNAQVETNRNTALTLACFQGRSEVVRILVENDANLEHRSKTGLTPLMEAASGGHCDIGSILLNKGADINACCATCSRDTPLIIAVFKNHVHFCKLLLGRSVQVDVRNKRGNTALWIACHNNYLSIAKLLVDRGADVDASDNKNNTPLQAAFKKGHFEVVKWLCKRATNFPSDAECIRFFATISDKNMAQSVHKCMEHIRKAKKLQEQQANSYASKLLEELHNQKNKEEDRKEKAARKREKRRIKKRRKSELEDVVEVEKEKTDEVQVGGITAVDKPPEKEAIDLISKETSTSQNVDKASRSVQSNNIASSYKNCYTDEMKNASSSEKAQLLSVGKCTNIQQKKIKEKPSTQRRNNEVKEKDKNGFSAAMTINQPKTSTCEQPQIKEKKYGVLSQIKRMVIASSLVSRVIGRDGCNVNAIRHVTGAQIDIDKMTKGDQQRIITLRGTAKAIYKAQQLIFTIMKENKARITLSKTSTTQNELKKSHQREDKTTKRVLVAAPVPAKPAWGVPSPMPIKSNDKIQRCISVGLTISSQTFHQSKSSKLQPCLTSSSVKCPLQNKLEPTKSTHAAMTTTCDVKTSVLSCVKITQVTSTSTKPVFMQKQQTFISLGSHANSSSYQSTSPISVLNTPLQTIDHFPLKSSWGSDNNAHNATVAQPCLNMKSAVSSSTNAIPTHPNIDAQHFQTASSKNVNRFIRQENLHNLIKGDLKSINKPACAQAPTVSSASSSLTDSFLAICNNFASGNQSQPYGGKRDSSSTSEELPKKLNSVSKPRPIGIERANRKTLSFPTPPPNNTSQVDLWSYDKISPEQLGISPRKKANWEDFSSYSHSFDERFTTGNENQVLFSHWNPPNIRNLPHNSSFPSHMSQRMAFPYQATDAMNFNRSLSSHNRVGHLGGPWNVEQPHFASQMYQPLDNFASSESLCSNQPIFPGQPVADGPADVLPRRSHHVRNDSSRHSWPAAIGADTPSFNLEAWQHLWR